MKEKLKQIKVNAKKTVDLVNIALQHLEQDITISRNEEGEITSNCTNTFEKQYDIQFKTEKKDKWHSFRWMLNNGYNPPELPELPGEHSFRIDPEIGVEVRFVIGEWYEDRNEFVIDSIIISEKFEGVEEREELPDLPADFITTLWDSWNNDYKGFLAVKLRGWGDAEAQYDRGKTIILSASHTWKEKVNGETVLEPEWKWERRLKRLRDIVRDFDPNRYLIFLQDEPLIKSHWTLSDLNRLIDLARDGLPDGARIGMSFTNGSVLNRDLPKGLDFYCTGNYHFKTEWAIARGHKRVETKEEYDEVTDSLIKKLREKVGGDKDIYLLAQAFYNPNPDDESLPNNRRRWSKPVIEYPLWLREACVRNNLQGFWIWLMSHGSDEIVALEDMPELYEKILSL